MKILILISSALIVFQISFAQVAGDTIVLKGEIGNHYFLSSTHNLDEGGRQEVLDEITDFKPKMDFLDEYYSLKNEGKLEEAKAHLQSDDRLARMTKLGIGLIYTMARMKELDILFLPNIQCRNSDYLIVCDFEQFEELEPYLNNQIVIQLTCTYYARIEMDNTKILKLIEISE